MMLTAEQHTLLDVLIQNHLGMNPSMMTVRDLLGYDAAHVPTGNTATVSRWIIRRALAMPTPGRLALIVDAVDPQQELIEIRSLLAAVATNPEQWGPTGFDELWVPDRSWPFMDREDLRLVIGGAAIGNGQSAMVMEAPTGFGKRTMCSYVDMVVRREGQFGSVVRHIQPDPDPGMLDSLVADLRIELGVEDEGIGGHEEPERAAVNRAASLALDAALAPTRIWFVANLIEPTGVEPDVLRFLDELLGHVQSSPATAQNLRMILLTSDASLLSFSNLPGVEARHVLPEVTEESIIEWLAAASPGKPEALYALSSLKVLQNVEQRAAAQGLPPSQRLAWLARQCRVAHRALERATV